MNEAGGGGPLLHPPHEQPPNAEPRAEHPPPYEESSRSRSQLAHHPPLPPIPADCPSTLSDLRTGELESGSDGLSATSATSGLPATPSSARTARLQVSLHVCKRCQDSLLGAFDHCLAQHAHSHSTGLGGLLQSVHAVDEVEDARRLDEPPYFRIVRDPTRPKNQVYVDIADKVERERWVTFEGRRAAAAREDPQNARVSHGKSKAEKAGMGIDSGHVFSGALYKRTLEAKDKEIQHLREKLYDRIVAEQAEHATVDKLRTALNKSVNYYAYAEEWQSHESARLQQDVRYLKAEMSSLMAFLINSEEEKRKLRLQVEDLREEGTKKDLEVVAMNRAISEMKEKLHQSFKEFLSMDDTMTRLRKEAERGSDITNARNEVLQRNLDKLSRDYEAAVKDLTSLRGRVGELEFELGELVSQFNSCGEAKRKAEALNVKLTTELDRTTGELHRTRHSFEMSTIQNRQLESDLEETNRIAADVKYDLEVKIYNFTKDLGIVTTERNELDASLKTYKVDNDRLSSVLKSLTRAKDSLESAFRVSTQKHEKEIMMRESKIQELANLRVEDAKATKALQEQKEQLLFQVTDLQNSLDRETANVSMLNFEVAQVKRQSEEKVATLEEQIEKLLAAKGTMANDKRLLLDKLKTVRGDLHKTEEEYAAHRAQFSKYRSEGEATEAGHLKDLAEIRDAHKGLQKDHARLQEEHRVSVALIADLQVKFEASVKRSAEYEAQLRETLAEVKSLTEVNERIQLECAQAIGEKADIAIHRDSLLLKVDELTVMHANVQRENALVAKQQDAMILKLTQELYLTREDVARLDRLNKKVKHILDTVETDLAKMKKKLAEETFLRETLEARLYDIRKEYEGERKNRIAFERMNYRVERHQAARELERLAIMRLRDRKLDEVAKGLKGEYTRLNDISHILPASGVSVKRLGDRRLSAKSGRRKAGGIVDKNSQAGDSQWAKIIN
ncbi:hypothetical protein BDK51DRAFT_29870 [Blyttiomyces helicus]|uniref:Uncharacterized protein n=1 Tax=Blyttiomyces helicus TaxID=388810 RepID=A0A4P9WNM8_9FUNG|nr:hypothetical protein BDK51DRAFT_29870 [Blyttiomyces helicus]|eukprot:RKO94584.1 hypothetical protein BDK51DRAFT_29870 [Blyttiomyces helicus]